jgi:hypothetical protein
MSLCLPARNVTFDEVEPDFGVVSDDLRRVLFQVVLRLVNCLETGIRAEIRTSFSGLSNFNISDSSTVSCHGSTSHLQEGVGRHRGFCGEFQGRVFWDSMRG